MSRPIGIGSRFRVLTGIARGRIGVIDMQTTPGWWRLYVDENYDVCARTAVFERGADFQRLADAQAEPDPVLAEIDAGSREVDMEVIGGAGGIVDMIRNDLDDGDDAESDDDWFASRRIIFANVAALCLAGMRDIDRRAK